MLESVGESAPDCANAVNQAGVEEFPYDASTVSIGSGLEVRLVVRE